MSILNFYNLHQIKRAPYEKVPSLDIPACFITDEVRKLIEEEKYDKEEFIGPENCIARFVKSGTCNGFEYLEDHLKSHKIPYDMQTGPDENYPAYQYYYRSEDFFKRICALNRNYLLNAYA